MERFITMLLLCITTLFTGGGLRAEAGPKKLKASDYKMTLDEDSGRLTLYYRNESEPFDVYVKSYDLRKASAVIKDFYSKSLNTDDIEKLEKELSDIKLTPGGKAMKLAPLRVNTGGVKPMAMQVDKQFTLRCGEVVGRSCYIWELDIWKKLGENIRKYKKPYVIYWGSTPSDKGFDSERTIEVDPKLYSKMERKRFRHKSILNYYKKRRESQTYKNKDKEEKPEKPISEIPILDFNKEETEDYYIISQLDQNTGLLLTYVYYNGDKYVKDDTSKQQRSFEDDFYKNLDIDSALFLNLNVRNSFRGLVADWFTGQENYSKMPDELDMDWVEINNKKTGKPKKDMPEKEDRLFTLKNRAVFGTSCYIWELDCWNELGLRLTKYKKPFALFNKECFSRIMEYEFFDPNCSVIIDEKLFNKMNTMRNKQK